MAGAEAATDQAKPAEKSGPVLDPQTEELFRFIDALKKLKESEDLEKSGGGAAVIQQSSKGGLAALALGLTALAAIGVIIYGLFTWLTSAQEVVITDSVVIMNNARTAFDKKRYDETIAWTDKILGNEQKYTKSDFQDAALLAIKSKLSMDQVLKAGKAADSYSRQFDSESGASAEKRGEFHHLEGEISLKLAKLNPDQRFKDAYDSDKKNFARLKDKLRYIQCQLNDSKDIQSQIAQLDELKIEVNTQSPPQPRDKTELLEKIDDWHKHLDQLKN